MHPETVTERLRLRPLRIQDAAATVALITPGVSRWTATWPETVSVDEVEERIGASLEQSARGASFTRAIERREDGALLGWIGIHRNGPDGARASLGYWLGEPFHGRGYMTEAAAAFVSSAWAAMDVSVIEAAAQPANTASVAVLERLGMAYVGIRQEFAPVRDRFEPCAYFEIARP